MKILVIGDTHTKDFIIDIAEKHIDSVDRIVFLGDYVDEWDDIAVNSINHLRSIINFAKKYSDKVTLLLGNHDYAYVYDIVSISGHNRETELEAKKLFLDNEGLFSVAYGCGRYLFTHAGVSNDWLESRKNELQIKSDTASDIAESLNKITFLDMNNILWDIKGYHGSLASGPLWIRPDELLWQNVIIGDIIQVVGHSPVKTVVKYENIYIADTFSLYPDMEPIGDGSLLMIDTEKEDGVTIISGDILLQK